MELYWSTSGRKIASHLAGMGVELNLEDAYRIELAVRRFYPNHIIGVIDQVLSGKASRLGRAQEQGWDYFHKPVYSMLSGRKGAIRDDAPEKLPTEPNTLAVFKYVQRGLLIRDMDEGEAMMLLYMVPPLVPKMSVLADAIRVCADRDARNVRYLHGVLNRRKQEKVGITRKQRVTGEPWEPPADYQPLSKVERAQLEHEWEKDSAKNIAIMKKLRSM